MWCWIRPKQHQSELKKREIERAFQTLHALIPIVEKKANVSRFEIEQLALMVKKIYAHFPNEQLLDWEIYLLAHLLFTSRIKIPDYIYQKQEKISAYEVSAIGEHVVFADEILGHSPIFNNVIVGFRHHHERFDGSGFPGNKQGEQIPFSSRVLHIVESYVSMISPRSYRQAATPMDAALEIKNESGKHYDPQIIEVFLRECVNIPENNYAQDLYDESEKIS